MTPRILTIGTFDLLHTGHLDLLENCAKLGSLWVGVNSDAVCIQDKRPAIIPAYRRMEMVHALGCVDATRLYERNINHILNDVKPDILVVGEDWAGRDYLAHLGTTQAELDRYGVTLLYMGFTRQESTTDIIGRIRG